MTYKIGNRDDAVRCVEQVVRLADQNSKYLGHFPASCFKREAERDRVIVALDENDLIRGYVLYRTTRDRAVVQHLCVNAADQGRGIGKLLIDELKRRTRHLPTIVCHCARDFPALAAWKRFGFVPIGEKKGRGRDQRPLVRLAFDHGHKHLFTEYVTRIADETLVAVLDVNVCVGLQDGSDDDAQVEALRSDWLLEEVSLWITDETLAEAARQNDHALRQRRMSFLRGIKAVTRHPDTEEIVFEQLRSITGHDQRVQDRADLRQLSQAIVGEADVFLTWDEGILRKAGVIKQSFDIEIMAPADLVLRLDEVARANEYAPERLQGSAIEGRLVAQLDVERIIDRFLSTARGEKRHRFVDVVRRHAALPERTQLLLVTGAKNEDRALMISSRTNENAVCISALRIQEDRLAETLARHLLQVAIKDAVKYGCDLVVVDEPYAIHPLDSALRSLGFCWSGAVWIKACIRGLVTLMAASSRVEELILRHGDVATGLLPMKNLMLARPRLVATDAALEEMIWPGRLRQSDMRTFVVPIRPRYARHLFDSSLAHESVFGSDPTLSLNCENVYYRSAHVAVVAAPSRVLWYVSEDRGEPVRALRACSQVVEVEIGAAKDLFGKYRRLGVYEWNDMRSMTDGDPHGEVMAIRFGPTECFPCPIDGTTLRSVIQSWRNASGPNPLSMPVEIPPGCFEELYERGHDKRPADPSRAASLGSASPCQGHPERIEASRTSQSSTKSEPR